MKNNKVTQIGSFEDTLLWMSCRYWMSDTASENENFAENMINRYWSGLSDFQLEKMLVDFQREKDCAWGNTDRAKKLISLHIEFLENDKPKFQPYEKCDDIEFSLIRFAILYACPRQTIASSCLPSEIIEERYDFLSDSQKNIIVSDLQSYLKRLSDNNMKPVFGNERIDNNTWQKFMTALDSSKHETVELINGEKCVVFRTNSIRGTWNEEKRINEFAEEEMIYPLDSYLKKPHNEIFIPKENIKW